MFLDASSGHCWADAMRVIAIEPPPEDEVKDKDLVREVSRSLVVTAHNGEKMWQNVVIEMKLEIGMWSSSDVYICERIHRIRRDDFVFVGGPMQWACTEFQLSEKMILKKQAVLDLDDDGKTVGILSRLVFWEIEIRTDPRHWEILLAKMKLDSANEIA